MNLNNAFMQMGKETEEKERLDEEAELGSYLNLGQCTVHMQEHR